MRIILAEQMGFCSGVKRAIKRIEEASETHHCIYTLGQLVHNPQVVERLRGKGVRVVPDVADVTSGLAVITAHGARPGVSEELSARGIQVIDTTCALVRKVQHTVKHLTSNGYHVLIVGESDHPEVKGLVGWADSDATVVSGPQEVERLAMTLSAESSAPWRKIGVVSQTTQNQEHFRNTVGAVVSAFMERVEEIRVVNTICASTGERQRAARELAAQADLVIVVGGRNSGNTRRLAEIARAAGAKTHHVEDAVEILPEWVDGRECVGVTAGASTPDWVVEQVIARLERLAEERRPAP